MTFRPFEFIKDAVFPLRDSQGCGLRDTQPGWIIREHHHVKGTSYMIQDTAISCYVVQSKPLSPFDEKLKTVRALGNASPTI